MRKEEALEQIRKWDFLNEEEKEAIQTLIPELAESEDERARKWLLDYAIEMIAGLESDISLSNYDGIKGHDPEAEAELAQWQKARAYLEKQKNLDKMIVVSPEVWDNAISDAYENGKKEGEKQKEQKHYWKPTETDVALFNKAVTTNNTLTPAERANLDIIRSKFSCCHAINCSGVMQKEQKPVKYGDDVIEEAEEYTSKVDCGEYGAEVTEAYIAGVLAERNRGAGWSKEGENGMFSDIIMAIRAYYKCEREDLVDYVKSLRPSWKPSEEQMEALKCAIADVARFSKRGGRQVELENEHYYSALHSLYGQLKKLM